MELWIARDKDGKLELHKKFPIVKVDEEGEEYWLGHFLCYISKDLYPEVIFENSPQKVKIELIKE